MWCREEEVEQIALLVTSMHMLSHMHEGRVEANGSERAWSSIYSGMLRTGRALSVLFRSPRRSAISCQPYLCGGASCNDFQNFHRKLHSIFESPWTPQAPRVDPPDLEHGSGRAVGRQRAVGRASHRGTYAEPRREMECCEKEEKKLVNFLSR